LVGNPATEKAALPDIEIPEKNARFFHQQSTRNSRVILEKPIKKKLELVEINKSISIIMFRVTNDLTHPLTSSKDARK